MPFNEPNWDWWENPSQPGSPQGNYNRDVAFDQAGQPYDWEIGGFDPTNPFGTTLYNPAGGSFQITDQMRQEHQTDLTEQYQRWLAENQWMNPGGFRGIEINGQSFAGMDSSGNLFFNPNVMGGMFGQTSGGSGGVGVGGGVSGYNFTDYPEFQEYDAAGNAVGMVDPYQVQDFAQSIVNTNAAIAAAMPGIYEQQDIGFANAANRMGQSGMAMSTPYAESLGGVARKSANDIASLTEAYKYNASEAFAERAMQEQLQERALAEQAWAQQQQLNQAAQIANQQAAFQAWNAQNQYGQNQWQNQNTLGMEDYWNQQDYGLQQQQLQQQQQQLQQQQQMAQQGALTDMMAQIFGQIQGGMPGMP